MNNRMRRVVATPCPMGADQYRRFEETYFEDTTTNLEYTTAFQASFRNVRPKRVTNVRREAKSFVIHEDEPITAASTGQTSTEARRGISRLSQPAKRVAPIQNPHHVSKVQASLAAIPCVANLSTISKPQRNTSARNGRLSQKSITVPEEAAMLDLHNEDKSRNTHTKEKSMRRRTLYVPPDDTTQPTMWMGMFSSMKNEVVVSNGEVHPDVTGIAAQMIEKRQRRTSTIYPQPRRVPLNSSHAAQGTAGPQIDRPGNPTGKENLPPKHTKFGAEDDKAPVFRQKTQAADSDAERRKFLSQARLNRLSRPKTRPSSPEVETLYEVGSLAQDTHLTVPRRVARNSGPRAVIPAITSEPGFPCQKGTSPKPTIMPESSKVTVPTKFIVPRLRQSVSMAPQMLIPEHIQHPEMYEDDWLGQQEMAITQLLNKLFDQTLSRDAPVETQVGKALLSIYNGPEAKAMYSRVKAAILYGSLSSTHENIFHLQSLVSDIGKKQRFLRFWLDNYDNELLKHALEVVTGKQCLTREARRLSQQESPVSCKRTVLANFIEAFILRHEEAHFKPAGTGTTNTDLGNKTVLKSLMLLKALDLVKAGNCPLAKCCLFRRNAAYKSSTTALQALMSMLNPAVGDPQRALRHLDYEVSHEQQPLEELTYNVENLAVDIRDGVILTRLVEILMYGLSDQVTTHLPHTNSDTICVREGVTITLSSQDDRPLSQHLRLPCPSRATKLWNVEIAFGALANVKGIDIIIGDVAATDIVDGHREKTIKLMWTLVTRFGMTAFVDQGDLTQEIRRLNPAWLGLDDLSSTRNTQDTCEHLLKEWTRAVAASKGHEVRNFTSSFSDGKVFEDILDVYEPYLIDQQTSTGLPLDQRLLKLGCSRQFSRLFSIRHCVHMFGVDFVLAALAFLCSRVLGPSKLCRKVVVIQRHWRTHWQRVLVKGQAVERNLAVACAAPVTVEGSLESGDTESDSVGLTSLTHARSETEEDVWLQL